MPGFYFGCFVAAGPVVKFRLRRPRELGDRALRQAALPPLKKELTVPPSCLVKEILFSYAIEREPPCFAHAQLS